MDSSDRPTARSRPDSVGLPVFPRHLATNVQSIWHVWKTVQFILLEVHTFLETHAMIFLNVICFTKRVLMNTNVYVRARVLRYVIYNTYLQIEHVQKQHPLYRKEQNQWSFRCVINRCHVCPPEVINLSLRRLAPLSAFPLPVSNSNHTFIITYN